MRAVSAEYLRAVRGSHTTRIEARVLAPGATGVDPAGTPLRIIDGNIRVDGTADIRSTIDITIDGTGLWPTRSSDLLLAPYGNEIFVRRGIEVRGGSVEWVSLGYYRIDEPDQDRPTDGPISITGSDRMAGVVDGRLVAPVQFGEATLLGDVVEQLVGEVYPWTPVIDWDDDTDTQPLGRSVIADEDRFAFLDDLVKSRGKIWYWDYRGHLVITDPPTASTPVWDVNAGAGGVLVSARRTLSRKGVYNAVVARGQAADTAVPARAVVVDDNPASPTYWDGNFGRVPRFYDSPLIVSDAQAQTAAASMLREAIGLPYNVTLTAVPNVALEPYDPITIGLSDGSRETHILDVITVPLTAAGALTGVTREQTVVLLGVD